LHGLDIFPANEYLVSDFRIDLFVNGFSRLFMGEKITNRLVTLLTITKGHYEKKLVISLAISIHNGVTLPTAYRSCRMNKIGLLHMFCEVMTDFRKSSIENSGLRLKQVSI